MKIKLMSSNLAQPNVPVVVTQNTIEAIVAENQVVVGVAPVVIGAPPVTYSYILINRSAGGQIIRIGFAPSFGPAAGDSILVGEALVISSLATVLSAVANGVGALLDRIVFAP
jgi:hypothetical protein